MPPPILKHIHCQQHMAILKLSSPAYLEDGVRHPFVARAIGRVKVDGAAQEGQEQGVASVGVGHGEGWVREQLLDILEVALHIRASLQQHAPVFVRCNACVWL